MAIDDSELVRLMNIVEYNVYDLEHQLDAVKRLGESASEDSLGFLIYVYEPTIKEDVTIKPHQLSSSDLPFEMKHIKRGYNYGRVDGPLRGALNYSLLFVIGKDFNLSKSEVERKEQEVISKSKAHQTFVNAIRDLEISLE